MYQYRHLTSCRYVKPQVVEYQLDGQDRKWEMVKSHPSVAVVLYRRERDTVCLVRQFVYSYTQYHEE